MNEFIIEIATSDFISSKAACEGGADRIELCDNLQEGGTTASIGTIKFCREKLNAQLFPIIRPRGGDFLYTPEELSIMAHDINVCKQIGCDGVVVGLLKADGNIDVERTSRLIERAYPLEVTFHRAFDRCIDPFKALEELIKIGCNRVLTSGQKPVAAEGIELIRKLIELAAERIIIMPGSGVRKENILHLAKETGATEFHASLRKKIESKMLFRHPAFNNPENCQHFSVIPEEVAELRQVLNQSNQPF